MLSMRRSNGAIVFSAFNKKLWLISARPKAVPEQLVRVRAGTRPSADWAAPDYTSVKVERLDTPPPHTHTPSHPPPHAHARAVYRGCRTSSLSLQKEINTPTLLLAL